MKHLGVFLVGVWFVFPAFSAEFRTEVERDFPVRSMGTFEVRNPIGSVRVQGWTQDRIRVQAIRTLQAENEAEAQLIAKTIDFTFTEQGSDLELAAVAGKGLDLSGLLKQRKAAQARLDLVIKAPMSLKLKVWEVQGTIEVNAWNASVTARAYSGKIQLTDVMAGREEVNLVCPECSIELKSVKGLIRCVGGSGDITAEKLEGKEIFFESQKGAIHIQSARGRMTLTTSEGSIRVDQSIGHVEFSSRNGKVELLDVQGFASGRTLSSPIRASISRWSFDEKAILESENGSIDLELPVSFSGFLDLNSNEGGMSLDLPLRSLKPREQVPRGILPAGTRVRGWAGESGPMNRRLGEVQSEQELRVASQKGAIRVKRRP